MSSTAVLIVDDERNIRLTLSLALEALNISADTASTGEEALQKLQEKNLNSCSWISSCRAWMAWKSCGGLPIISRPDGHHDHRVWLH
jgi:CheY-like chemotaxis protein